MSRDQSLTVPSSEHESSRDLNIGWILKSIVKVAQVLYKELGINLREKNIANWEKRKDKIDQTITLINAAMTLVLQVTSSQDIEMKFDLLLLGTNIPFNYK